MRISRLTIAGFGPYKTEQQVDFARFDDDGLFLISGRTGAGKSSILDAICYALYGSVPRYDGTEAMFRSDHAETIDPTFVELEFSVDDRLYRVRRVPAYERPRKTGDGLTKQAHEATLWVRTGDAWEGIAAKPVDVGRELAGILTLNREQFLQVILLAQNRFQEFLLAKNDERQAVLRTLFDTRRFQDIEVELDERRKVLAAAQARSDESLARRARRIADLLGVDDVPTVLSTEWIDSATTALGGLLDGATTTANDADREFGETDRIHSERVELEAMQQRRETASAALAALSAVAPSVALDRFAIAAAHRAAPVLPLAAAVERATSALEDARATTADARAVFELYNSSDAEPLVVSESVTGQLATLAEVLADESRLPALDSATMVLDDELSSTDLRLRQLKELGVSLPSDIAAIEKRLVDATARAARTTDAAATLSRLTATRAAAVVATATDALLATAAREEKAASGIHLDAVARLDGLLGQRLTGFAAELATALVQGEPCAVCGSLSHPQPAASAEVIATESMVETARTRSIDLGIRSAEASATVRRITIEHATADAHAGGQSVDEIDAALSSAQAEVDDAAVATADVTILGATRDTLWAQLAGTRADYDELQDAREQTLLSLTEARTLQKAVIDRVLGALDGFDSVAERVERLSSQASSAAALAAAISAEKSGASAVATALRALTAEMIEQQFEDVESARAARLEAADISLLETRIRSHDDGLAAAAATIADVAAAGIPIEPVDVELSRENRRVASAARDAALTTMAAIRSRKFDLDTAARDASTELASSEESRAEYDQVRQLAAVIAGNEPNEKRMRLESFVLAAQLEQIVGAANLRLNRMTGGRFALEHDDSLQFRGARSGLSLAIRDEHTGRSRATHSLSGGETFLASLALALGLAEVVTNQAGGIRLDTLFVDEGFGSLDSETLEIAMATLDGLRAGGRTIGLISHVEAMKEQIPSKLLITVNEKGLSEIA